MVFYDNTAVVTTACNACSSGSKMKSGMGMGGGMGTMMGMGGGMYGNLSTSTGMGPIRNVIKGAVNIPYEAGSESVMTVTDVLSELTRLNVVGATRESVMDAAMIVQGAGTGAVQLVMDIAEVPIGTARSVVSMFKNMSM
tara:strand:+ start:145 stop:564 length:420 start_codon:yes stop_codon:yes gene_type:complete